MKVFIILEDFRGGNLTIFLIDIIDYRLAFTGYYVLQQKTDLGQRNMSILHGMLCVWLTVNNANNKRKLAANDTGNETTILSSQTKSIPWRLRETLVSHWRNISKIELQVKIYREADSFAEMYAYDQRIAGPSCPELPVQASVSWDFWNTR